jgi:hypothetical protein
MSCNCTRLEMVLGSAIRIRREEAHRVPRESSTVSGRRMVSRRGRQGGTGVRHRSPGSNQVILTLCEEVVISFLLFLSGVMCRQRVGKPWSVCTFHQL